ncbi:carboxylesterase family protein [Granulicella sp. 5B5]|nr:carboxylesterase family protein [Granulicella sp. 5B5]
MTVMCGAACSTSPRAWSQGEKAPIVTTAQGQVEGLTVSGGVHAYLGIPYAAPPVGDLRWKAPQPAEAWKGIRDATHFGHRCMQFVAYPDMVFDDAGESEDCLTLNVWAPADAAKLPVMVWVHGGGFVGGASSEPRQNGQHLARHGVIVVSMNYRLGMLGFFTHAGLAAESGNHAAGNYGLMDQVAAIAWVKKNIAAFGGDPDNITVFGESAGSFSVSALMASPLSKGMLAKAIGESGAGFFNRSLPFATLAEREAHDAELAKSVLGTDDLEALRKVPAETIAAEKSFRISLAFPPDIDGYMLPKPLPEIYAAGEQAHIPLLAGWNHDEVRSQVTRAKTKMTVASYRAMAEKEFGVHASGFLKAYPGKTDAEAESSAGDYVSDRFLVYSTWRWLDQQVATGDAPVYRYRLDLVPPADKFHPAGSGAFHSDDIEYVFGTLDSRQEAMWRPEDRMLSEEIQTYWTNFAKTGDPNSKGLPEWPQYKSKDWMVMHLDEPSVAKPDNQRAHYLFLDSVWGK